MRFPNFASDSLDRPNSLIEFRADQSRLKRKLMLVALPSSQLASCNAIKTLSDPPILQANDVPSVNFVYALAFGP